MLILVLTGFVAAIGAVWAVPRLGRWAGIVTGLAPLSLFVALLWMTPAVLGGRDWLESTPWVPALGVSLDFRLDGLSLIFGLLITGIGALVMVYAGSYLRGHPHLNRFYAILLAFMAAMLGLVLSDNLIGLFVFWELTSVTSYLLVGFSNEKAEARAAALQALLITSAGGLALLAGLILVSQMAGTMSVTEVLSTPGLADHPYYEVALVLLCLGAFTKSAQFPFHIWLPGAMAAPTPVSAYLHSATMVKAGIYLLARFSPAFGDTPMWTALLTAVGGTTLVAAGVLALGQRDLKRLLAYSTVAALGTMVLLLGVGTPVAIRAAIVVLLSHAFYKGALFLVAGIIDHEAKTRDVTRLGGLRERMPRTALAAGMAGLSMAGLPPLLGFVAKELFYEATLYGSDMALLLTVVAVAGNAMTVGVAGIVVLKPLWGKGPAGLSHPHDPDRGMWIPPMILASAGLLAELVPGFSSAALVRPASSAVLGFADEVKLSLWHGFTPMLGLSVVTVLVGFGLYALQRTWRRQGERFARLSRVGPAAAYEGALRGLVWVAKTQTRWIQSGVLRRYVTLILVTLVGLTSWGLIADWRPALGLGDLGELTRLEAVAIETVAAVMILAGAIATLRSRSRLAAVALLGLVGFGVALLFFLFSGIDLAITQFAVETLAVLLFVFVLYKLPRFASLSSRWQRLLDATLALAVGAVMTVLVLAVTRAPKSGALGSWLADNAVSSGKGRNVVNVILVDFRALDTLGEITVLTVAALGVYALLKLRPGGAADGPEEGA